MNHIQKIFRDISIQYGNNARESWKRSGGEITLSILPKAWVYHAVKIFMTAEKWGVLENVLKPFKK